MKKNFIIVIYQMTKKILILLQKQRNLTFYLYSLKKNIFMIINTTFLQTILFRLKENI